MSQSATDDFSAMLIPLAVGCFAIISLIACAAKPVIARYRPVKFKLVKDDKINWDDV